MAGKLEEDELDQCESGRILTADVRTGGVRVRTNTYGPPAQVEDLLRASRLGTVVGAPPGRPEELLEEIAAHRRASRRVEPVALAVLEAPSRRGVLNRHLPLAVQGRARYVARDNHDTYAAAPPTTRAAV